MSKKLFINIFAAILFLAASALAQTSAFVYQGKLNDGNSPANGTYQFEFKLYDSATVNAGNQVGSTLSNVTAIVTNGIFSVNLDFGADSFDGNARFLEIGIRLNGSGQNYTMLSPRQPVTSTPYSVKSMMANQANTALLANDATKLGNVPAAQYVITTDTRMSDARTPMPNSTYYIQNGTSQQQSSSFNISGEGAANIFNAATEYKIAGVRAFHLTGASNTFVGFETGNSLANGTFNAIFGTSAGRALTTGTNNSFFGSLAGRDNITGTDNSFFGQAAGLQTNGSRNSFFGYGAGVSVTSGEKNTFVGYLTGQGNTNETENTFIGYKANGAGGITNATAIGANSFATQSNSLVLGTNLITVQVPGNLTVANTFSANALDSATVYKIAGNRVFHLTGTDNTFVGFESGNSVTTGGFNAFYGAFAGKKTTSGSSNAFFGSYAGRENSTGIGNAFFGSNAGLSSNGSFNAFFGSGSGLSNMNGANNSYFGYSTGANNSTGDNNSFFGSNAGKSVNNSGFNSFFGSFSGEKTTTGAGNTFVGTFAGRENTIGFNNTYIGYQAGQTPTTGNGNVVIGYNASVTSGVSNSIAIGQNVQVTTSNTIFLGNNDTQDIRTYGKLDVYGGLSAGATSLGSLTTFGDVNLSDTLMVTKTTEPYPATDKVTIKGDLKVGAGVIGGSIEARKGNFQSEVTSQKVGLWFTLGGGTDEVCITPDVNQQNRWLARCSSSRRYKDNIQNFSRGLELVQKLRPVTFNWKDGGKTDVGFVAEEVNEAEPLLSNYNNEGQVEGVRYAQITTALVNAVKEQQTQIETEKTENRKLQEQLKQQQAQIDALKSLVCAQNPTAAVCAAPKGK